MHGDGISKTWTCSIRRSDIKRVSSKHRGCSIRECTISVLLYFGLEMLKAYPEKGIAIVRGASIRTVDHRPTTVATRSVTFHAIDVLYFEQLHTKFPKSRHRLRNERETDGICLSMNRLSTSQKEVRDYRHKGPC